MEEHDQEHDRDDCEPMPIQAPSGVWLGAAHDVICPEHGVLATLHSFEMTDEGLVQHCSVSMTNKVMNITEDHLREFHQTEYLRHGSVTQKPFLN